MKFYILSTIVIMMIAVGTANAQSVNIGTKIGLNSYNIINDNGPEFDNRMGLYAGLIGYIHMSRQFGLQPELYYSMQGAKSGGTTFELDYINVPVMFQYMFDNGFRVQTGPQIGFLINGRASDGDNSMDIRDDFNAIDVGLGFGASYIHNPSGFGIDLRYNLGLTDITESSLVDSQSRGVQLGIFYLFNHFD
jgi:hypothetical protein